MLASVMSLIRILDQIRSREITVSYLQTTYVLECCYGPSIFYNSFTHNLFIPPFFNHSYVTCVSPSQGRFLNVLNLLSCLIPDEQYTDLLISMCYSIVCLTIYFTREEDGTVYVEALVFSCLCTFQCIKHNDFHSFYSFYRFRLIITFTNKTSIRLL